MTEHNPDMKSNQPVCIIINNKIVYSNEAFDALIGCAKDWLLTQDNIFFLFQKDDIHTFLDKTDKLLRGEVRVKPFTLFINTLHLGKIFVEIQISKIQYNGMEAVQVIWEDRSSVQIMHGFFSYREKYLNDILSNPFLAFNIVDHKGHLIFFNEGCTKLTGYAGYEVLGKHYTILYPGNSMNLENSRILKSDESGAKIIETNYKHKSGISIPIQLHLTKLEDEAKTTIGYIGVAFDITESVKNREAIKQSNKELQSLVSLSETITETLDLKKTITESLINIQQNYNIDYIEIFFSEDGKSLPEICYDSAGFGESESFSFIKKHIDGCEKCSSLGRLYCPINITTYHKHILNDTELMIPNSILIMPLTEKHRYIGALSFYKAGEKEFSKSDKLLFSSVANLVASGIYNALLYEEQKEDARIFSAINEIQMNLSANLDPERLSENIVKHIRTLCGCRHVSISYFDPYEYWNVQSVSSTGDNSQVFTPGTRYKTDAVFEKLKKINTNYSWRYDEPVPSGSKIIAKFKEYDFKQIVVFPIISEEKLSGTLQIATKDNAGFSGKLLKNLNSFMTFLALTIKNAYLVTDLGNAYEHLKHAQDIIVRTERLRALGEMSAGVAHDFNNILGAIYARAQMLVKLKDQGQLEKGLAIIEKAAKDGAETVRRLQEFTRIRKDQDFELIELEEMLKDVISLTSSRWKKDSEIMNIKTDIITEFENIPPLMGNPSEFREALINIFLNAFDAMPEGGTLHVRTFKKELNGQIIQIGCSVKDTGVGMSKDVLARIFDPFFTTKGAKGSGLGMSLVYGIIRRHKGVIKVESEEGKGTEIILTFPPGKESQKVEKIVLEQTKSAASSILIIDDNIEILQLIKDILTSEGHTVESFSLGEEGVAAFSKGHFDLVISDLGLPTISGWDVADQIKKINPSVPIILITGWGMQLSDEDLKKHNIELVLSKPFDMFKLIEVVNTGLQKNN